MAVRKAFINWQRLDAGSELENKQEYMICVPMDGNTGCLYYATYYEKGTVIGVQVDDDYKISGEEPTAEERLMRAIFGNTRAFTVPEDGFYITTGDYGVDEKESNGAFEGCREQAVCMGNRRGWTGEAGGLPVYWAELPLLPEGRTYFGSGTVRPGARTDDPMAEEYEALYGRIQEDGVLSAAYRSICGSAVPGDVCVDHGSGAAVYSVSPYKIAKACEDVHGLAKALAGVPDEAFSGLNRDIAGKGVDDARAIVHAFFEEHGLPERSTWLVFAYGSVVWDGTHGFYYYRDKRLAAGGLRSLNVPAVLQEAWGMSLLPFRIHRYVRLLGLGAPEIILANELRICVEHMIAAKMGQNLVHVLPGFDALFGVSPDGSRGTVRCEFGDKELSLLPEPDGGDEGCEDCGDAVEMDLELEPCCACDGCSGRKEPVVGVDVPFFAVVPAPNFLMRRCRFVLWDNTRGEYLKDAGGAIEQFQDWAAAKARSEELAEEKRA